MPMTAEGAIPVADWRRGCNPRRGPGHASPHAWSSIRRGAIQPRSCRGWRPQWWRRHKESARESARTRGCAESARHGVHSLEGLDRCLPVNHGRHDVAVLGLRLLAHHDYVSVCNGGVNHGVTADSEAEQRPSPTSSLGRSQVSPMGRAQVPPMIRSVRFEARRRSGRSAEEEHTPGLGTGSPPRPPNPSARWAARAVRQEC